MTAERVYAVLLRLYPRRFRLEYGDEMLDAFAAMARASTRGGVAFWAFVIADTVRSSARERLDGMRWLATAASGLLITTVAGNTAAWAYRYFYHPYFEGVTVRALPYGAALGLVLGTTVAVAQRLLFPAAERRARQWLLASATALPVAILFCSAAIARTVAGLRPLANAPGSILDLLVLGVSVARSRDWLELTVQFAAMAASAAVARAIVLTPLPRSHHAR